MLLDSGGVGAGRGVRGEREGWLDRGGGRSEGGEVQVYGVQRKIRQDVCQKKRESGTVTGRECGLVKMKHLWIRSED